MKLNYNNCIKISLIDYLIDKFNILIATKTAACLISAMISSLLRATGLIVKVLMWTFS